jgi:hypothetical protein
LKIGSAKVRSDEICSLKVAFVQIGSSQYGSMETAAPQIRLTQIHFAKPERFGAVHNHIDFKSGKLSHTNLLRIIVIFVLSFTTDYIHYWFGFHKE